MLQLFSSSRQHGETMTKIQNKLLRNLVDRNDALASKCLKLESQVRRQEKLLQNAGWEYSAEVLPLTCFTSRGKCPTFAKAATRMMKSMKDITLKMRQGAVNDGRVKVSVKASRRNWEEWSMETFPHFKIFLPHWKEFADALSQYSPSLDRHEGKDKNSSFEIKHIHLPKPVLELLEGAFANKHHNFTKLRLENNDFGSRGIKFATKFMDKNPLLEEVELIRNEIDKKSMQRLCDAIQNHNTIHTITIQKSFPPGKGMPLMKTLLKKCKDIKSLNLSENHIVCDGKRNVLAEYLASNPSLEHLDLRSNRFNDVDAIAIAAALKTNTNLRSLDLRGNPISQAGCNALRSAFLDGSGMKFRTKILLPLTNHHLRTPESTML